MVCAHFSLVAHFVFLPYLEKPNPSFERDGSKYFTVVVKGKCEEESMNHSKKFRVLGEDDGPEFDSGMYAFLCKENESVSSQPKSCEEEFEQFSMDANATCKGTEDPLSFWSMNRKKYPRLSLVAKNILSCPGASVAVERVFNIGRDVISLRRSALGPEKFKMKGGNVQNFLRELNPFGYKSNVFKTISLIATMKKGYNQPFTVRDQSGKNLVATEIVKDGDRLLAMVQMRFTEEKDGNEGITFELLWLRLMEMDENTTKKRKLGQDDGPSF
jgi:hypothetical protein